MRNYILSLILAVSMPAFGATLNTPVLYPPDAPYTPTLVSNYAYGTGTYMRGFTAAMIQSDGSGHPARGTTGVTYCYTFGTTNPTATTPGTCDAGSTTYSTPLTISGSVQVNMLATESGQTNSAVNSVTLTIIPMVPTDAYAYVATVAAQRPVVLSGVQGGNVIYTTDGTTPAVTAGTCTPTNGAAIANGTAINLTATTTVTADSCVSGTLTPLTGSPATYTIHSAPTTWYIRTDGGTRYDANQTSGQCNGTTDAAYPGTGTNQNCAFSDVRYLWDDQSNGSDKWTIAGGDVVDIEGCAHNANQPSNVAPDCRIGWDNNTGAGAGLTWCFGGVGNIGCYNPPIPDGTSTYPTKILGACAFGTYSCDAANTYPYTSNLTQLFAGFGAQAALNLTSTYINQSQTTSTLVGGQNIVVEGLELTTHDAVCSKVGSPTYPRSCVTSGASLDDYGGVGIMTDDGTSGITLQDIYIHGNSYDGIQGPIGGPVTMTRVIIAFNPFAGWNFAEWDNPDVPDWSGSTIDANYVTQIGNGCSEQYPISNTQFPALACWDSNSGGFGDSWSGQDTELDSFTCDHCVQLYNTKDGFIGPHTQMETLLIEDSESIGNMGQQWKWGQTPNNSATTTVLNTLTVGNCTRLAAQLTGAAQNFNQTTGLGGSYLSNFCRANGDVFSFYSNTGGNSLLAGNTTIGYNPTIFDLSCGQSGGCTAANAYTFTDDVTLGYTTTAANYPGTGQAPGLYFGSDPSGTYNVGVTSSYNVEYGIRNGDGGSPPGVTLSSGSGILTADPLFVNEPAQGAYPPAAILDNFNFNLASGSPAIHAGTAVSGLTTDYYGTARPNPPSMGAIEYGSSAWSPSMARGAAGFF